MKSSSREGVVGRVGRERGTAKETAFLAPYSVLRGHRRVPVTAKDTAFGMLQ